MAQFGPWESCEPTAVADIHPLSQEDDGGQKEKKKTDLWRRTTIQETEIISRGEDNEGIHIRVFTPACFRLDVLLRWSGHGVQMQREFFHMGPLNMAILLPFYESRLIK